MCTIYGILLHFTLFWCRICLFLRFTLFCRKIGLSQFTRFCVEKILATISDRGEKMTNMRYGSSQFTLAMCCPRQVLSLLHYSLLSISLLMEFVVMVSILLQFLEPRDVGNLTRVKQSPAGSPSLLQPLLPGVLDPPASWHSCTNLAGPSFLHSAISAARLCCIFSLLNGL